METHYCLAAPPYSFDPLNVKQIAAERRLMRAAWLRGDEERVCESICVEGEAEEPTSLTWVRF